MLWAGNWEWVWDGGPLLVFYTVCLLLFAYHVIACLSQLHRHIIFLYFIFIPCLQSCVCLFLSEVKLLEFIEFS